MLTITKKGAADTDISRRQRLILEKIVGLYTAYGDPVGSKYLGSVIDELSVSSATLRNEMATLTSLGYLEQPHTSAGRVPTVMGYRYYVDNLMRSEAPDEDEKQYIKNAIENMDSDAERAAEEAARLLSRITGVAAITTTPKGGNVQITHFELIRTGRYNVAVLAVSSVGGVKTRVCRLRSEITDQELAELQSMLNRSLVFISAEDVSESLVSSVMAAGKEKYEPIIRSAVLIIKNINEVRVYSDGQQTLLQYHELDGYIGKLLDMFSDTGGLKEALETDEPLKILVGEGPGHLGEGNLGMVVGRYRASGGRYGAIAVAGPFRMNYGYIVPRLDWFRTCLSNTLTGPI